MIKKLLLSFEDLNGQYVSWKNNHEIDLALNGESDLDVYVPYPQKELFFELIKSEGWINVKNPIADYPEVYHFYNIGEDLKVYHLHVYFKMITGESWLKEYDFPINEFLIDNRIKHSSGIYILNNKAQAFLFVLRHFAKGSSNFSRILYKKELKSYKEEWNLCKSGFEPDAYRNLLDFTPYFVNSGLNNQFQLPNKQTAKKVRRQLKSHLRFPISQLNYLRCRSFITRAYNKFILKRSKILPKDGFVLAFSGADGVGKSTMSESIADTYKRFLTVKEVRLGKPQSAFIENLRKVISKPQKEDESSRVGTKSITNGNSQEIGLKKAVGATYLAYLRFKAARKAEKYKNKKYLVISDRWPTLEYDKMDGPKLRNENLSGVFKMLSKLESRYYKKIISSDCCITLTVPLKVAIERNRERVKEGKETDQEIIERHTENTDHSPKAKENILFDNNGDLYQKRFELINILQNKLLQL